MLKPEQNPWKSSLKKYFHGGGYRQLMRFRYTCPLCQRRHEAEYYMTTASKEVSTQQMRELAADLIPTTCWNVHLEAGDLDRLLRRLSISDVPKQDVSAVRSVKLIDESAYTCDFCKQTFENVAELRLHMGRDPYTNRANPAGKGVPVCKLMPG